MTPGSFLVPGESMCLLRAVRPGNCSCHAAALSPTNTTADVTARQDAWITCGQVKTKRHGPLQVEEGRAGAAAAAAAGAGGAGQATSDSASARVQPPRAVDGAVGSVLSSVGVPVHAYLALTDQLAREEGSAGPPQDRGSANARHQQQGGGGREGAEAVAAPWSPSESHSLLSLLPRVTGGHVGAAVVVTATSMQQLPGTLDFVCR